MTYSNPFSSKRTIMAVNPGRILSVRWHLKPNQSITRIRLVLSVLFLFQRVSDILRLPYRRSRWCYGLRWTAGRRADDSHTVSSFAEKEKRYMFQIERNPTWNPNWEQRTIFKSSNFDDQSRIQRNLGWFHQQLIVKNTDFHCVSGWLWISNAQLLLIHDEYGQRGSREPVQKLRNSFDRRRRTSIVLCIVSWPPQPCRPLSRARYLCQWHIRFCGSQ